MHLPEMGHPKLPSVSPLMPVTVCPKPAGTGEQSHPFCQRYAGYLIKYVGSDGDLGPRV
jgi:hypothetical protein